MKREIEIENASWFEKNAHNSFTKMFNDYGAYCNIQKCEDGTFIHRTRKKDAIVEINDKKGEEEISDFV